MKIDMNKLVNGQKLLDALFEPEDRPTTRTLFRWRDERIIPYIKINTRVYYDVDKVRESLAKKNLVRAV